MQTFECMPATIYMLNSEDTLVNKILVFLALMTQVRR